MYLLPALQIIYFQLLFMKYDRMKPKVQFTMNRIVRCSTAPFVRVSAIMFRFFKDLITEGFIYGSHLMSGALIFSLQIHE